MDAEHVKFDSVADEQTSQKQATVLVAAYLAYVPHDEPRPLAVEAAVEAPLVDPVTGEEVGIRLVGVIDLILPDDDGPTIADFKTAARGGDPLEIKHEVQLSALQLSVSLSIARPMMVGLTAAVATLLVAMAAVTTYSSVQSRESAKSARWHKYLTDMHLAMSAWEVPAEAMAHIGIQIAQGDAPQFAGLRLRCRRPPGRSGPA